MILEWKPDALTPGDITYWQASPDGLHLYYIAQDTKPPNRYIGYVITLQKVWFLDERSQGKEKFSEAHAFPSLEAAQAACERHYTLLILV
jgi:hypothetical protein